MDTAPMRKVIEKFRECKTTAQEREFVTELRAQIRNRLKDWDVKVKAQGILKLIWLNMMGYETEFSQVECMSALFNDNIRLKIIGYLGLSFFVNAESEVLCMATNLIRRDLETRRNDLVVSLALKIFSEISDNHMIEQLLPSVQKLIDADSKHVRRRALLAMASIIRKCPDHAEEIVEVLKPLLKEPNDGLLLPGLQLAQVIITVKVDLRSFFKDTLEYLYSSLRSLNTYENSVTLVNGVGDPFLQCAILCFAEEIIGDDASLGMECSPHVMTVINAMQGKNSPTARAVLYQCARLIMSVKTSLALKRSGIGILGDFLSLKNKNYLFASLNVLESFAVEHREEVRRYAQVLRRCARGKDITLKQKSLNVLICIVGSDDAVQTLSLVFEQLEGEYRPQVIRKLSETAAKIIQTHTKDLSTCFEAFLQLIQAAGVKAEAQIVSMLNIFAQANKSQTFLLFQTLTTLKNEEGISQEAFTKAVVWLLGEFYELLFAGRDSAGNKAPKALPARIHSLFYKLSQNNFSRTTNFALIFALSKIFAKGLSSEERIFAAELLAMFTTHKDVFVARKAAEMQQVLGNDLYLTELFEPVPLVFSSNILAETQPNYSILEKSIEEFNKENMIFTDPEENIFDLLDFGSKSPSSSPAPDLLELWGELETPSFEMRFITISMNDSVKSVEVWGHNFTSFPFNELSFSFKVEPPARLLTAYNRLQSFPVSSSLLKMCDIVIDNPENTHFFNISCELSCTQENNPHVFKYISEVSTTIKN